MARRSIEPESAGVVAPSTRARRAVARTDAVLSETPRLPGWAVGLGAFLLYAAITAWILWPALSDLGGTIWGAFGDLTGSMAIWREIIEGGHVPFLPGRLHDFNAPAGMPVNWTLYTVMWPTTLAIWLPGLLTNAIVALTLYQALALPLSALAGFLLVRKLTGAVGPALVAGFALGFFPFAIVNGGGHPDYAHVWVLVIPVWRLLVVLERPGRRNVVLAALALVFAMSWTPYFVLLAGVAWATLAAVSVGVAARQHRLRRQLAAQGALAAIYGVVGLAMLAVNSAGSTNNVRSLSSAELYTYSARPWEYVLPWWGPLERLTGSRDYLVHHLHGSNATESTLYVGISVLALALVAVVATLRGSLPASERRAVVALSALVVAAALFSAPPTWGAWGLNIPMPADVVWHITGAWRAYSRFVVVVMIGLSALAGIGLHALTRGHRPTLRLAVLGIGAALVVLDLAPQTTVFTPLAVPRVYSVLAKQPPGLVAQYPLLPAGYSTYNDLYFQDAGRHATINGYASGSVQEQRALQLQRLDDPRTLNGLEALGVRYVLVANLPTDGFPAPGRPGRGFVLLARDNYASLYRVARGRVGVLASVGQGFGPTENLAQAGTLNWLMAPRGQLLLKGNCTVCRGRIEATVGSLAGRRRVLTIAHGGRVIFRGAVTGPRALSLPVRFSRAAVLVVTASPGPVPVKRVDPGSNDPRSLSVYVQNLGFANAR